MITFRRLEPGDNLEVGQHVWLVLEPMQAFIPGFMGGWRVGGQLEGKISKIVETEAALWIEVDGTDGNVHGFTDDAILDGGVAV